MFPILLDLSPVVVTSFGLFLSIAFIAFIITTINTAPKRNVEMSFLSDHIISLIIAALIGSKLLYWIFDWSTFVTRIQDNLTRSDYYSIFKVIFNIEEFFVIGGILAFAALFYRYARKKRQSLLKWLDVLCVSGSIALFFGYIGSFLGGYFMGRPTGSFLGLQFSTDPTLYPTTSPVYVIPVHPIQLYAALASLITFFILLEVMKKMKEEGVVGVIGIVLISFQLFIIEFFRGADVMPRYFELSLNQYAYLGAIAFALYLFTKRVPRIVG